MSVDFATYIANERARIAAGRRSLVEQIGALKNELAALDREEAAIKAYEAAKTGKAAPAAGRNNPWPSRGRREEITYAIRSAPEGMSRGELLENLGVKGDKSGEMSVSNALTAMTKRGQLERRDGKYVTPELKQAAE
jgi:hypothetical protein